MQSFNLHIANDILVNISQILLLSQHFHIYAFLMSLSLVKFYQQQQQQNREKKIGFQMGAGSCRLLKGKTWFLAFM